VGSILHRPGVLLTLAGIVAGLVLCVSGAFAASPPATGFMTYITGLTTSTPQAYFALANGASPVVLGVAQSAMISPDGSDVAAVSPGGASKQWTLKLYPTPTFVSNVVARLSISSSQIIQLLGWSADSKLILVAVGTTPAQQLNVIVAATGKSRTVSTGVIDGASFAPGSSDEIVYARSAPKQTGVNVYTTSATGSGTRQLTHDSRSEDPLWGKLGIVFSRETPRAKNPYPSLQLWFIKPDGTAARRLTNVPVPSTLEGLEPVAFSSDGAHLLANFVGPSGTFTDTEAYTLNILSPGKSLRDLTGQKNGSIGDAISADGQTILVTKVTAQNLASVSIETVPWSSGKPTTIVTQGGFASWNQ
jgi:hypothetical protein